MNTAGVDETARTNPESAQADWPPAVIAGAFQTGVLAVRGLRRRGVRVVCFDCNPAYPGFRSAYGPARLCPDPDVDAAGWVLFMRQLAAELGSRPVLIASADQFVSAIAENAAALEPHYRLSPAAALHGVFASKRSQYELAMRHGMPLPRTGFVSEAADIRRFASEAAFPCLLKPLHFREWQRFPEGHPLSHEKVAIAANPAQLLELWDMAARVNPETIVQEIIEGTDRDKRVYLSCYDNTGRRIGNAMFRELRCDPVGFGPASVSEPVVDAETDGICDSFLRATGYRGICEIEMKRDSRDGAVKMIEANPRLSGGGDAAPYAGVDLAWLHYLDMTGHKVTPVSASGKQFRHIVLRSDVRTVLAYRRRGLITWREVLGSYKPPLAFYDLDLRDWRYSIGTLFTMFRSAVGGLLKSLGLAGRTS